MIRVVLSLLYTIVMIGAVEAAESTWSGSWDVTWPAGGGVLRLEQHGSIVKGSYRNGLSKVEAKVDGLQLIGQITQDGTEIGFSATLTSDQSGFSGQVDGSWLSGTRLATDNGAGDYHVMNLDTPRTAMRSFLEASNIVYERGPKAYANASEAVEFETEKAFASEESRVYATENLYKFIDLATFDLALVPDNPSSDTLELNLPRSDNSSTIDVKMKRGSDGRWRILFPAATSLSAALEAAPPRPVDSFRLLQSPRDTLRTFLEGMGRWQDGGEQQAISTIDLSDIPEFLHTEQGRLTAHYLVRLIDKVGYTTLQSIPNSGFSREPFVYFKHPLGQIVIEPVGAGEDTRWKFSASSNIDARRLLSAVELLPSVHALAERYIPPSGMFAIRQKVALMAPLLVEDILGRGILEYWQVVGALLVLVGMVAMTVVFKKIVYRLLKRKMIAQHLRSPSFIAFSIGLGLSVAIGSQLLTQLGLPAATRQFTIPIFGSLFIFIITHATWEVITALISVMQQPSRHSRVVIDSMLLTFGGGIARLALLVGAVVLLGQLWSIPTTGLIAGLGISGLAIAFASKETLANVFGAGILLGDRPFRTGDRIVTEDVDGWVEEVGLRSTRLRTIDDSVTIVPNGVLADTTIKNLGSRRRPRFMTTLLVTSGATPENLRSFTKAISSRISGDPSFLAEATDVDVTDITPAGVQINISSDFKGASSKAHRHVTHKLLLDILSMARAEGLMLGSSLQTGGEG